MTGNPPERKASDLAMAFQHATGRPLSAMIEISDRCNEVCVHCYQEQGNKGEMSTDELRSLLDQLAEQGVLFLTLSGGEATLRKDFLEIVEHAHRHRFVTRLFTNGLTMTRELARALHRFGVFEVEISLYSPRPDVHDFVTGVPRSFERTTAGIRHLTEVGVPVMMKSPLMSINEQDVDAYVALAEELGASYQFDLGRLHDREGGDSSPSVLNHNAQERLRVLEKIRQLQGKPKPPREGPLRADPALRPCGAGSKYHIEPNGELRPCALLEVDLGNARHGQLSKARTDNPALSDLVSLSWVHLHGCRDCDLAGYCGRCYASSLEETGDALGPYPSACDSAIRAYETENRVALGLLADADAGSRKVTRPVTGPFQFQSGGQCVPVPDRQNAADAALAARLPWVRRDSPSDAGPGGPVVRGGRPGELVQLRRPGQKRAIKQRIPSGVQDDRVAKPVRQSWATTGGTE